MLTIDGSSGEGGGQILRTSLALSLITSVPFRIDRIRAGRQKPGLQRQHLTAVHAAAALGAARVDGGVLGSRALTFVPGRVEPDVYHFDIGSAGSAGLVVQTVLPPLLFASGPSLVTVEGGTHNPNAPTFDFLARAFVPVLGRMGARVRVEMERPGFYPAGGGRVALWVEPADGLRGVALLERGQILRRRARAVVANLPLHIADRELRVVEQTLGWSAAELEAIRIEQARGPGNVLTLEAESEGVTEVVSGFGARGVPAERVAAGAADRMRDYLEAGVPVGEYLADQLLLPLALAGEGTFRARPLSRHSTTNMDVIRRFLSVEFETRDEGGSAVVEVRRPRRSASRSA